MRSLLVTVLFLAAAAWLVSPAHAQFSIEARTTASLPVGDLADQAALSIGYGVTGSIDIVRNVGVYAGYSRTAFDLDDGDGDARAVDSGFSVGLTADLPRFAGGLIPQIGAGVLLHDLEVEGAAGADGDSQAGFEVNLGVAVPLVSGLRLTPGIGYRQYTAPFLQDEADISSLSAGVGLQLSL